MNFLQRIRDGAGRASERAQSAVEIGKLNSHISDIQREIEVHYLRMGQVFYENYSKRNTAPAEEEILELCTACDLLTEEIAELRSRIADLRNEQLCECGARLDADAVSCPHCGRQWGAAAEESVADTAGHVELRKASDEPHVEAEAVHDLVEDPDFELEEDREAEPFRDSAHDTEEVKTYRSDDAGPDSGYAYHANAEAYSEKPVQERVPAARSFGEEDEDEQFETKRFELGQADESDSYMSTPQDRADGYEEAEETREQREERQRRELREIRIRERRKMKEDRESATAVEPQPDLDSYEENPEPTVDPEHERRQREREEREKERQDELDRLIASWDRGVDRQDDDDDERIVRRPVGEVVRCQVCGSGLPKGSKWCPHCASEQI
ncbi:hypothetical protein [Saccharibacillus endophyticus]|uniref:Zinc ribbon domain-containing protein n=1 Tax=Saccharibacillus endophyticus TaxID=2060666 RepID=A0ABQ1ZX83_9BACL|nr:hypothetical protein [Saccharibacillus endophyticus]GGH81614.1 hypothetical protein GCM10007362_31680 [Saccharibacillus endophyticus]